jgi:hypothetical protein
MNKKKHDLFGVWSSIKRRSRTGKIKIDDRWMSFSSFVADMGDRPEGYIIGRLDVTKDYNAANCRWMTRSEASMRRRVGNKYWGKDAHLVTFEGRTLRLAEWSRLTGISKPALAYRLSRGWDVRDALTRPVTDGVELMVRGCKAGAKTNRRNAVLAYAHLMPMMVESREQGATLAAIAKKLNDLGHRTRTGSFWTADTVLRALKRRHDEHEAGQRPRSSR